MLLLWAQTKRADRTKLRITFANVQNQSWLQREIRPYWLYHSDVRSCSTRFQIFHAHSCNMMRTMIYLEVACAAFIVMYDALIKKEPRISWHFLYEIA